MSDTTASLPAEAAASSPAGAAWLRLVERALAGRAFDSLVHTTDDGIRIEPLVLSSPGLDLTGRGAARWAILQRIDLPDPAEAAAAARADLANGATGLVIVGANAPSARGGGLPLGHAVLADVLAPVDFVAHTVRFDDGNDGFAAARMADAQVKSRGLDPRSTAIAFGIDPVAAIASSGNGAGRWSETRTELIELSRDLVAAGYRGPLLSADARPYHEAGASEATELAAALATATAYLDALLEAKVDPGVAVRAIDVVLPLDADQFLSIAKLRAMRLLWARVLAVSNLPAARLAIHAETSYRMTTRLDPHSNLLRATIAAFAGAVGGADSMAVLPYTAALGPADDLARRLARNTQAILADEANLFRVADPASGSGSVEALTEALAEAAWREFQAIEREGGIVDALTAGDLQSRIAETRDARLERIRSGTDVIVGVTGFRAPDAAPLPPAPSHPPRATETPPLPSVRLAEAFEEAKP